MMSDNSNVSHILITDIEQLSYDISDILCWMNGFKDAKGDNYCFPFNLNRLRELNIELKRHIDKEQK